MQALRIFRHVQDTLARYGASAALHDIGCHAVNVIAEFQILRGMTARLRDINDPSLFDAPGFHGRFVSSGELAERYEGAHELSSAFLLEASLRGDRCYALFEGDALASYGWYSNLPSPIDEHFVLHFARVYTYMYKGYTLPAYRGMRLHAVGMCRALREFTAEGKAGLISYVQSNNFASLRSVARMGYRIFGEVYLLRVGGRRLTYATKSCRDYDFRVEPTARPRRGDRSLPRVSGSRESP
ncbi:MAG: GNAT family acetyltransferase [Candidatus Rokuibacteriota bacterium]|nr:MAG: GNAT family acetyltransferase [Candidatus Rokubacteria bacterium]